MKIAVLPDASMLIRNLVLKHGHIPLSSTNVTEESLRKKDPYSEESFDRNLPPYNMDGYSRLNGNKYTTIEAPSGIRGRLTLYDNIIKNCEAAIIMGKKTPDCEKMYDTLNELILFCGGVKGYDNTSKILLKYIREKDIPILELAHPRNRDEIIEMIDKINKFLENPYEHEAENKNWNMNNTPKREKFDYYEFKSIVKELY